MTALWRTSLLATTAAVTAAGLGGCQRSEAAPPPISAPMHVVNHRPIVDAEVINGDGDAHRVALLIDTAAHGLLLSPAAARRARLALGASEREGDDVLAPVKVRAVRIGSKRLELGRAKAQVVLDSPSDTLDGVDGLVGTEVLQRYGRVTMNFPAERIVLGDTVTGSRLGTRVPAVFDEGVFIARVNLGAVTQRLVVDTGAVTTHVRDRVPIRITGTRQGVWGRVVLAPFEVVSDPLFRQIAGDGQLGGNLLERFTLRIDYERKILRVATT